MQRTIRILAATSAIALLGTGCGRIIERATEEAVERAVESDTGEDVDVDFSDGEIRIESSEGDVTFTADENGVQIDGTDADGNDFSLDADEGGVDIESGDGSVNIDDDGSFTATDENGDVVTGEVDGDGGFVVEDADGEAVFRTTQGIPEEWPSDVPEPEGLSDVSGSYFSEDDTENILVTGTTPGSLTDSFEPYTAALISAGFEEQSTFTQGDDAASATFVRGGTQVTVSLQSSGDTADMVVSILGPS